MTTFYHIMQVFSLRLLYENKPNTANFINSNRELRGQISTLIYSRESLLHSAEVTGLLTINHWLLMGKLQDYTENIYQCVLVWSACSNIYEEKSETTNFVNH